ncbi:hypothetical protein MMC24_001545 [Lignoscripta atroalba]|nr:hypothetical protein [Lignoscripta atroalba]
MSSTPPPLRENTAPAANTDLSGRSAKTNEDGFLSPPNMDKAASAADDTSTLPNSPSPKGPGGSSLEETAPAQDGVEDIELGRVASGGPLYTVFSHRMKIFIVFMVSWAGFFSPLSANIYFPALNALAKDLHKSNQVINLTLTSYMIFQGLAPTIFGDLADMAGRRPAYFIAFVIYIGANIGLALQDSYVALFLLRCLQATGSSGTIALANGVVGDVATNAERGSYFGWALSAPMIGPAIGPVLGGILTQFLGWRSIFWFLTIMSAVFIVPFLVSFPETGRNVVGNGSVPPQGWNMSLLDYLDSRRAARSDNELSRTVSVQEKRAQAELASHRKLRWPNPLRTVHIILEKDVGMVLFYNAIVYTAFYDVAASLPSLFTTIYDFNDLQIGLCFIPFGAGCALSSVLFGKFVDWNYQRVATHAGIVIDRKRGDDMKDFPIEKARIQVVWIPLFVGIAATVCYGWVLEQDCQLAAPLVLTFIIGLCFTGAFNVLSTMLIDLYPQSSATATAANNLCRCLMGAAGTAIIVQMIDAMGRGWCFTFIALIVLFFTPMLWAEQKWGPKWREARRVRIQKHEADKVEGTRTGEEK